MKCGKCQLENQTGVSFCRRCGSATQYPDLFHAEVSGKNAAEAVGDQDWLARTPSSPPSPSAARRSSRRAVRPRPPRPPARRSTTPATGCWAPPTTTGCRWRSCSDGSYGVPEGLISSFPVTVKNGAVVDRPGPGDRRLLARQDRRLGRRARRGARRRQGSRPDLSCVDRSSDGGPGPRGPGHRVSVSSAALGPPAARVARRP